MTELMFLIQACESHDHDHQWKDYAMVWLLYDKRKREHKVTRLVWDFDCLHFAQYILISPHGIDCKKNWCKKIYRMDRVSWLKPLNMSISKSAGLNNNPMSRHGRTMACIQYVELMTYGAGWLQMVTWHWSHDT